ncbi:hypothetical protein BH24ACI2_BH24ACI2_06290 [soil metagenome]|jgi:hypothetical protein|nr:hypothetical protein [Acidobacteriota bacterium]
MSSLMTIFLAIGGLGFLFLLISFVIGDIFEAIGFDFGLDASQDFGVFDSRVISVFLTAFGGFGAIGTTVGYGAAGSSLFGLFGGVVFGAIVFFFGKFLFSQQSSSSVATEDLIGRTAQVIVGIKPNQLGQISCRVGEERVEKLARAISDKEIKIGEVVRIDSVNSDAVLVSVDEGKGFSLFSEKA